MASIQILELRPVDGQIEDLSYDKTGLIMGGDDAGFDLLDCAAAFLEKVGAQLSGDGLTPGELYTFLGEFLRCTVIVTGAETV